MGELLERLAERHADWIRMAKSFGADYDTAQDLVQDMYIRMYTYVKDFEKIRYGDEPNTFFVYITLRNLYLRQQQQAARFVSIEEFDDIDEVHDLESDLAFTELAEAVKMEVARWDWYDNKLFTLYHDSNVSMRKLSSDTKISLRSIYHTLKNGRERIKSSCEEEYQTWSKAKRSRG
jgi:RNA polymerase sigma factor (sigma-70 family)